MAFAESQRDVSAHRVSHERAAFDPQLPKPVGHGVGQKLHRMLLARDDRDAVAGQVQRNHPHFLVEEWDEIFPYEHGFEIAVQQYDASVSLLGIADVQGRGACHNEFVDHGIAFIPPLRRSSRAPIRV